MNKFFILLTLISISFPASAELVPCKYSNFLSCLKMTKQSCQQAEEKAEATCSKGISSMVSLENFNINKLQTALFSCVKNNFIQLTGISQESFEKCVKYHNDNPPRIIIGNPTTEAHLRKLDIIRRMNGTSSAPKKLVLPIPGTAFYQQQQTLISRHSISLKELKPSCNNSSCTEQGKTRYIPTINDLRYILILIGIIF